MEKVKGPQFLRFCIPIVEALKELGGSGQPGEVTDTVLERLQISEEEQAQTFTLLDVQGQPIAGATTSDTWFACTVDAPRNVSTAVDPGVGIVVNWDPVNPAPGFDPGGAPSLGFYQIELGPENGGDGGYGANAIKGTSHTIPLLGFGGAAPGSPDGFDFGKALEELADGTYGFDVIAFAEAPPSSIGGGLECQIRASGERVRFAKSGDEFTILP